MATGLDDVGCPICLEILVEPITMPCQHRLCKPCFVKNLELTNLHCPFCKRRISTWCRRAKKVESLVDTVLWKYIQDSFPTELAARQKGTGATLFDEGGFSHDFCDEDGMIGREFEEQMKRLREEDDRRRDKELVESRRLIGAIQLEEMGDQGVVEDEAAFLKKQQEAEAAIEQQKKDEALARQLQSQMESEDGIALRRHSPRPKRPKGPRQMTLEETLGGSRKRKREEAS